MLLYRTRGREDMKRAYHTLLHQTQPTSSLQAPVSTSNTAVLRFPPHLSIKNLLISQTLIIPLDFQLHGETSKCQSCVCRHIDVLSSSNNSIEGGTLLHCLTASIRTAVMVPECDYSATRGLHKQAGRRLLLTAGYQQRYSLQNAISISLLSLALVNTVHNSS